MSMSNPLFPPRSAPFTKEQHIHFLRESIKIAHRALLHGRHPFGCILVDSEGDILFTQGNIDTLNHAEATLCRTAWSNLRSPLNPLYPNPRFRITRNFIPPDTHMVSSVEGRF